MIGAAGGPPAQGAAMGGLSPQVLQQLAARQGHPGPTPATTPVANEGMHAAGVAIIGKVVKGIELAIPLVGSASEAGAALISALQKLGKFAPPSNQSPGIEKTENERMALMQRQMGPAATAQHAAMPAPPNIGTGATA